MAGELLNYHSFPDVYSVKSLVSGLKVRLERGRPAFVLVATHTAMDHGA